MRKAFTFGDGQELECPHCGYPHCFQDWLTDGWSGGDTACDTCGKHFKVTVDYDVVLTGFAVVR